jgi:predicted transcriptional regulator
MTDQTNPAALLPLVSDVVAAHLSNNKVPASELSQLIRNVYEALAGVSAGEVGPKPRGEPAVAIKKSVSADYVVCLEDGKECKMLKRHLRTAHGMSTEEYRKKWGLPADYPMVAPNYAKKRSRLAKAIGLGTKPRRKRA